MRVVSMHLSGLADNKLRDQAKRGLATGLRKQLLARRSNGPVVKFGITSRLHREVRGSSPHVSTNLIALWDNG